MNSKPFILSKTHEIGENVVLPYEYLKPGQIFKYAQENEYYHHLTEEQKHIAAVRSEEIRIKTERGDTVIVTALQPMGNVYRKTDTPEGTLTEIYDTIIEIHNLPQNTA